MKPRKALGIAIFAALFVTGSLGVASAHLRGLARDACPALSSELPPLKQSWKKVSEKSRFHVDTSGWKALSESPEYARFKPRANSEAAGQIRKELSAVGFDVGRLSVLDNPGKRAAVPESLPVGESFFPRPEHVFNTMVWEAKVRPLPRSTLESWNAKLASANPAMRILASESREGLLFLRLAVGQLSVWKAPRRTLPESSAAARWLELDAGLRRWHVPGWFSGAACLHQSVQEFRGLVTALKSLAAYEEAQDRARWNQVAMASVQAFQEGRTLPEPIAQRPWQRRSH